MHQRNGPVFVDGYLLDVVVNRWRRCEHRVHDPWHIQQLDKPSWVLADSTGYWRVVPCADRPGVVRVWFCVSVRLKARVPGFVIQLVSRLGLAKATRWLADLEAPASALEAVFQQSDAE